MLNDVAGYAPEKIPYGISRYQNETRRLYRVLDTALEKSKSGFIVGDRLTIADISCWGWVASASQFLPPPPRPDSPITLFTCADRCHLTKKSGRVSISTSIPASRSGFINCLSGLGSRRVGMSLLSTRPSRWPSCPRRSLTSWRPAHVPGCRLG